MSPIKFEDNELAKYQLVTECHLDWIKLKLIDPKH